MSNHLALHVRFDDDNMWVALSDGRTLGIPLAYFPRLLNASTRQRNQYVISGGGTGLHWDELDEDISVEHLLLGHGDRMQRSSVSG
ncbi:MAG TPA: DUF2442 domain-containing protein [Telluria sp.]